MPRGEHCHPGRISEPLAVAPSLIPMSRQNQKWLFVVFAQLGFTAILAVTAIFLLCSFSNTKASDTILYKDSIFLFPTRGFRSPPAVGPSRRTRHTLPVEPGAAHPLASMNPPLPTAPARPPGSRAPPRGDPAWRGVLLPESCGGVTGKLLWVSSVHVGAVCPVGAIAVNVGGGSSLTNQVRRKQMGRTPPGGCTTPPGEGGMGETASE